MKEKKKNKLKAKVAEKPKTELVGTAKPEKRIGTRGRIFEGIVIKKFPKRIVIVLESTVYVRKYERYAKARSKIHARLPESLEKEINIGDLIKVQECRPLSKIIHFIAINKIKDAEKAGKEK